VASKNRFLLRKDDAHFSEISFELALYFSAIELYVPRILETSGSPVWGSMPNVPLPPALEGDP